MSDARVTLSGRMSLLGDEDVAEAKKTFLQKNPGQDNFNLHFQCSSNCILLEMYCLNKDGSARNVPLCTAGSFWVDFGDFCWFRMDEIVTGRLVGGFGRIKQVLA